MFIAAKLLAFLTQPLAWVALLMLASLAIMSRQPNWSRRLGSGALVLLLVLGWMPLPDMALRQLERQYPALTPQTPLAGYAGVLVLGGALEASYVWVNPGLSALGDAAERMTEVKPLVLNHPQLTVIFTGGEGELLANGISEAERAKRFFDAQGMTGPQYRFESSSRTTYENAVLTQQLPGIDAHKPWLLLTSAWHMPRSMATFKKTGWNVTAYPVDFRSGVETPWLQYNMDQGVTKWKIVLHEWLGLLAYQLTGKT